MDDFLKIRCGWVNLNKPHYVIYHDEEWGVPVHHDQRHFEMLSLEGAQAGLSWETVLNKRAGYRQAFKGFDPAVVANMTDEELEALMNDPGIIRNRLKIYSVRKNALAFLKIQAEFGSYDAYIWRFVGGQSKVNHWQSTRELPASTAESDALSKDLKKRGMSFVGSTIMYACMQASGLVNDHTTDCWRYQR
jgi:DNA-3-methyladenine glycosylase I